jgi:hypothetical protein
MTIAMQPIYTQSVGAGGASSVNFNTIPQTFTDLKLEISSRTTQSGSGVSDISMRFNNDSNTLYSYTGMSGANGSTDSFRLSNVGIIQFAFFGTGNDATTSTFGSSHFYLPSYTGSQFKSALGEITNENNSSTAYWQRLISYLYRSTSPITSIQLTPNGGNTFLQHSTFTLYGITKG